jgi:hypothetical protein
MIETMACPTRTRVRISDEKAAPYVAPVQPRPPDLVGLEEQLHMTKPRQRIAIWRSTS